MTVSSIEKCGVYFMMVNYERNLNAFLYIFQYNSLQHLIEWLLAVGIFSKTAQSQNKVFSHFPLHR